MGVHKQHNGQIKPIESHARGADQGGHLMQWASKFQPRTYNIVSGMTELNNEEERITREVVAALEESCADNWSLETRLSQMSDISNKKTPSSGNLSDARVEYFRSACEKVWHGHDQKTSLLLQDKLNTKNVDYYYLATAIDSQVEKLMVHRFGNFLVQKRLETATAEEVMKFAECLSGRMATLSQNQFCCHVIQKLLDVSPLIVQAKIMAEMLENPIETMSSPFGTHVWQKLFYLTWSSSLPPIVLMVNNAVHLSDNEGWATISQTESGCAAIKSYLGIAVSGPERQSCVDGIVKNINNIIKLYAGFLLVSKVVLGTSTRARAISKLCSDAPNLAKHPVASSSLIQLLGMKIPSFPSRLSAALVPHVDSLLGNKFGELVLRNLGMSDPAGPGDGVECFHL